MIVDFMVRIWFGVNGSGLHESFRLSVVSGLLFTTAMTCHEIGTFAERSEVVWLTVLR